MRSLALAATAAAVLVPALILSPYRLSLLILVATFAVAALAQNLLSGYADLPSLGNVAFFAASSYTAASLMNLYHVSAGVSFLAGVAAAAGLGLLIGLPALRVSGMHLAIVTVAVVFVAQELTTQWDQAHGQNGVTVAAPGWLLAERGLYLAAGAVVALSFFAVRNLLRSGTGRALLAVADDPYAAMAAGISITKYRLGVFVLSGAFTGAAGILYLYRAQTLTPQSFTVDLSLAFLTMVIVGGSRTLAGSLLGAAIIGLLPELLNHIPAQVGSVTLAQSTSGIYAFLLLLTLWLFPAGIWNAVTSARWWRRWREVREVRTPARMLGR